MILSAFRTRLLCQNCWSIARSLSPIIERPTVQITQRTFTLSALYLQQSPPSSSTPGKKTSSILGNNDDQAAKTPFIFSKASNEAQTTKKDGPEPLTEGEKRERDARAAWDWKMLKYTGYFLGLWLLSTTGYIIYSWGSPKVDENGIIIRDEYSSLPTWQQYFKRAFREVTDFYQAIKDPSSDKLLPDFPPGVYQPPYVLVIEMSGVLLHPEWNYNTGWRYKKRPGLDYFLSQVAYPAFEVVLYTKEAPMVAASVVRNMDPEGKIMHHLFRENTRFIDGVHVKDLSCLNRDLKKIIFLDWDEHAYKLQPRNALHRLKKWNGEDDDQQLVHLASFLRMISASGVEDVRDVLDHYNQESDPVQAFLRRQQALLEAEEQRRAAAAKASAPIQQSKKLFSSWARWP